MTTAINNTSTTATSATSASTYMKQTTGLNKDDFMKLFVTQLKYQDPLAPQDSSAMVAQMAQLTQVEQSYNTNTNLQNLITATNNASSLSAVSFIGKTVTAQGSQIELTAGSSPQLSFNLPGSASQVQINIQDASGRTVRSMLLGTTAAGDRSVVWDGKDSNNGTLAAGNYTFTATGVNSDGSTFSATPFIRAKVDGVSLVNGAPVLTAGSITMALADVTSIK